jgi:hypothetical protein
MSQSANQCVSLARVGSLVFRVETGVWADYLGLARHHYRASRPATVCQVWRLAADWACDRSPAPLLWRAGGYSRLAGVLVVSYPVLQAAARNLATGRRYCTPKDRRLGASRLNQEVRTISRVIIHPLYRGLGLAGLFVADALGRIGSPIVEAFARMGEFVPFFEQAGMRSVRLPGRPVYYIWKKGLTRRGTKGHE